MVGSICCFPMDGEDHVGYWIDQAYWGRRIASRALQLLLQEVTSRPLTATAATDRYPACEEAVLVLRPPPSG
jgi:RimJ/RimL family protein N-acetyltransferase